MAEPTKLVCPVCGSGDDLVSWEVDSVGQYGVRAFHDPDNPDQPDLDYSKADIKFADNGGSKFVDDLQCNNHVLLELTVADLVPEGTPPNPDWQPPTDRPVKIDDETALDQIARILRSSAAWWRIANPGPLADVAAFVRSTGRAISEEESVGTGG
jgi:hypothetical protein